MKTNQTEKTKLYGKLNAELAEANIKGLWKSDPVAYSEIKRKAIEAGFEMMKEMEENKQVRD